MTIDNLCHHCEHVHHLPRTAQRDRRQRQHANGPLRGMRKVLLPGVAERRTRVWCEVMSEVEPLFSTSRCRDCGAEIIWAITANDKRMSVDAEPTDDGNVELAGRGRTPRAIVHAQPPIIPIGLRLSHFVTCPYAEARRRS
jgi:hypothetical protein